MTGAPGPSVRPGAPLEELLALLLGKGGVARVKVTRARSRAGGVYFVVRAQERPDTEAALDGARRLVAAWPNISRAVAQVDGQTYQDILAGMDAAGLIVWERKAGIKPRAKATQDAAAKWLRVAQQWNDVWAPSKKI